MAPNPSTNSSAGDPSVKELQAILVKYGYLSEKQVQTGPGILGPQTRAAVERILQGQGAGPLVGLPGTKVSTKQTSSTHVETHFYIVQAGDSPEAISRRLGVTWGQLASHPENAFLKERQRQGSYPIHPGDRLAIPANVGTKLRVDEPRYDASTVKLMVDYLTTLAQMHPAYVLMNTVLSQQSATRPASKTTSKTTSEKKQTQTQTKKDSQQEPPPPVLPLQGYTKKHPRLKASVVLTKPIESAFLVLLPYLPNATLMTSGYRSDADQARVINDYYALHKGNPLVTDVEKRRQWLVKEKGMKIARVGFSNHRTGFAFDLSGGDVDAIEKAVRKCAKEQGDKFPLLNTTLERSKSQLCVHVDLKPTTARTS